MGRGRSSISFLWAERPVLPSFLHTSLQPQRQNISLSVTLLDTAPGRQMFAFVPVIFCLPLTPRGQSGPCPQTPESRRVSEWVSCNFHFKHFSFISAGALPARCLLFSSELNNARFIFNRSILFRRRWNKELLACAVANRSLQTINQGLQQMLACGSCRNSASAEIQPLDFKALVCTSLGSFENASHETGQSSCGFLSSFTLCYNYLQ